MICGWMIKRNRWCCWCQLRQGWTLKNYWTYYTQSGNSMLLHDSCRHCLFILFMISVPFPEVRFTSNTHQHVKSQTNPWKPCSCAACIERRAFPSSPNPQGYKRCFKIFQSIPFPSCSNLAALAFHWSTFCCWRALRRHSWWLWPPMGR